MNSKLQQEVVKALPIVKMHQKISNNAQRDYQSLLRYKKFNHDVDDAIYKLLLLTVYRMRMDYCRSEKEYFYYKQLKETT